MKDTLGVLLAGGAGERLYPLGRRPRLRLKHFIEVVALISIAEPRLAQRTKYQRYNDGHKEREKVLDEKRAARARHGAAVG